MQKQLTMTNEPANMNLVNASPAKAKA